MFMFWQNCRAGMGVGVVTGDQFTVKLLIQMMRLIMNKFVEK